MPEPWRTSYRSKGFLLQPDADDLSTCVELAMQTPVEQLAADLGQLSPSSVQPSWMREMAYGEAGAWQTFTRDLHRYFDSSVAPWWPLIRDTAVADRAIRSETLLRGGIDALLATLTPYCRWEPPILHVQNCRWEPSALHAQMPGEYDVELGGHGLLLVPSYFTAGPMLIYRPGRSAVLVYSMHGGDQPVTTTDTLGPLLGRTRA